MESNHVRQNRSHRHGQRVFWNATRWPKLTFRRISRMHDLNALRRKIASARQEVRNLTRPAAGPAAAPRGAGQEPGDFGAGGGNGPAEAYGSRPPDADPGQVTAPSHEKLPPSLIDKAGNIRLDKLNQPEDIDQVIRDFAARNNNFIAERRHVI